MVNLIGKRVIVTGDTVTWDGSRSADIRFNLETAGSSAQVVIKDSTGKVVRHISVDDPQVGGNSVSFDGKDDSGNALAAGNYTFTVLGRDGKALSGLTTYANLLVDAVAFDGTDIQLKSRGQTISLADVSEVILN
jgi:flagellar basal-body rod modification protein FlgD